jgi:hypothetical protein
MVAPLALAVLAVVARVAFFQIMGLLAQPIPAAAEAVDRVSIQFTVLAAQAVPVSSSSSTPYPYSLS